jgi:hypothetical protein
MVITTVPPEFPFWQDLVRFDFFSESQENVGPDICKVVGDSTGFCPSNIFQIPIYVS